jgi:prevent-host-death family protein
MAKHSEKRIAAGQFKAKCLSLLDEVAQKGSQFVVTKRGKAVARLVPVECGGFKSLKGSVLYEAEDAFLDAEEWDMEKDEEWHLQK